MYWSSRAEVFAKAVEIELLAAPANIEDAEDAGVEVAVLVELGRVLCVVIRVEITDSHRPGHKITLGGKRERRSHEQIRDQKS
jgi:hypothetical protein